MLLIFTCDTVSCRSVTGPGFVSMPCIFNISCICVCLFACFHCECVVFVGVAHVRNVELLAARPVTSAWDSVRGCSTRWIKGYEHTKQAEAPPPPSSDDGTGAERSCVGIDGGVCWSGVVDVSTGGRCAAAPTSPRSGTAGTAIRRRRGGGAGDKTWGRSGMAKLTVAGDTCNVLRD